MRQHEAARYSAMRHIPSNCYKVRQTIGIATIGFLNISSRISPVVYTYVKKYCNTYDNYGGGGRQLC